MAGEFSYPTIPSVHEEHTGQRDIANVIQTCASIYPRLHYLLIDSNSRQSNDMCQL